MAVTPLKNLPKEGETINHKLLVQAGFVRQLMAGVYTYLPLGLLVLRKIENIVREEMNKVGGEEILMPMLHPAEIWKTSGGWNGVDVLFKLKSRTDKDYALGQSQEEVVTPLMKEFIQSYRNLPKAVYHIQWKFRDELRSKSGLMRGREFLMKDMYSWHTDQGDFERYYEEVKEAYLRIFTRLGLTAKVTEASGGSFSEKISYEFEVLTDAGEANILYCPLCEFCVNVDDIKTYKEKDSCPKCDKGELMPALASEVGNVFDLGLKYVKAFDLTYVDKEGKRQYPVMGCYGLGISRTMGVLVEKFNDQKGIIWPKEVSPFTVHLIDLDQKEEGERLWQELKDKGTETLWDDREVGAGVKFADADLIGCPFRVVVSGKTMKEGHIELKERAGSESRLVTVEELVRLVRD